MKWFAKLAVICVLVMMALGCSDDLTEQCSELAGLSCDEAGDCPEITCVCGEENVPSSARICFNDQCADPQEWCGGEDGLCEGDWTDDCFESE